MNIANEAFSTPQGQQIRGMIDAFDASMRQQNTGNVMNPFGDSSNQIRPGGAAAARGAAASSGSAFPGAGQTTAATPATSSTPAPFDPKPVEDAIKEIGIIY